MKKFMLIVLLVALTSTTLTVQAEERAGDAIKGCAAGTAAAAAGVVITVWLFTPAGFLAALTAPVLFPDMLISGCVGGAVQSSLDDD